MEIWRARRSVGPRVRALLLGGTVAAAWASAGLLGTPAVAAPVAPAASAGLVAPAGPCAALTGLSLPGLPGSDTATVNATAVAGSGCQVAIEITDTSDPRGGQPGRPKSYPVLQLSARPDKPQDEITILAHLPAERHALRQWLERVGEIRRRAEQGDDTIRL